MRLFLPLVRVVRTDGRYLIPQTSSFSSRKCPLHRGSYTDFVIGTFPRIIEFIEETIKVVFRWYISVSGTCPNIALIKNALCSKRACFHDANALCTGGEQADWYFRGMWCITLCMSETKHKNMVVRMTASLYTGMQTFASLNNVTVSDVMRMMCEVIVGKMRDAIPHQDTLVGDVLRDQGLRVTRDEPSPAPVVAPIEPPKTPSKPPLVQTPRAQPASPIPPTEAPRRFERSEASSLRTQRASSSPTDEPSDDARPDMKALVQDFGRAQRASSQQPPASSTTEQPKRKVIGGTRSKKDDREDADYQSKY